MDHRDVGRCSAGDGHVEAFVEGRDLRHLHLDAPTVSFVKGVYHLLGVRCIPAAPKVPKGELDRLIGRRGRRDEPENDKTRNDEQSRPTGREALWAHDGTLLSLKWYLKISLLHHRVL